MWRAIWISLVLFTAGCDRANDSTAAPCCKVCAHSTPCGDSCIANDKICSKPPGCACAQPRGLEPAPAERAVPAAPDDVNARAAPKDAYAP